MNMKDYDRLKQERDELAAQVEVMREALSNYTNVVVSVYDPNDFSPKIADGGKEAKEALSIPPSAALREIQARTLEDAINAVMSAIGMSDAVIKLRAMATAKRKGEPT